MVSTITAVDQCLVCDRVALARDGGNPYLVAEMQQSIFVVGDHQWHRGYSVVALKEHVREPYNLSPDVQGEHFREVMRAAEALERTFQPLKMNFSCYGNADPHVHWHLVPRYADDPHLGKIRGKTSRGSPRNRSRQTRRSRSRHGYARISHDPRTG
jgi:diadenosine tetraphosphate (Ap4A) HIT family hydrolase